MAEGGLPNSKLTREERVQRAKSFAPENNPVVAGLRSALASTLGFGGDTEGLGRTLLNLSTKLPAVTPVQALMKHLPQVDETPALPTGDFYRDVLPGKPSIDDPNLKAVEGAGSLLGVPLSEALKVGLGATKAGAKVAAPALKGALSRVAEAAPGLEEKLLNLAPMAKPMHAIKPKGGSWFDPFGHADQMGEQGLTEATPKIIASHIANSPNVPNMGDNTVSDWLDKRLGNYFANDMGTATDPLLKLEREGRLHMTPEQLAPSRQDSIMLEHLDPGARYHQKATGRAARSPWETRTDQLIEARHGDQQQNLQDAALEMGMEPSEIPPLPAWVSKSAGEGNPMYALNTNREGVEGPQDIMDRLGFGHVIDYLGQATDAGKQASLYGRQGFGGLEGTQAQRLLDAGLDIDPTKLGKMSLADVIGKTSDWNAAQAKWQADASKMLDMNKGIKNVMKQYPNGHQWVELGPEALANEGTAMGHCVGGYCSTVEGGHKRILSLRDKEGQPHVTVELAKQNPDIWAGNQPWPKDIPNDTGYDKATLANYLSRDFMRNADKNDLKSDWLAKHPMTQDIPWDIRQIKGKQNKAPIADYQPAVQDLVKNMGPWGDDIRDLQNTGLTDIHKSLSSDYIKRTYGLNAPSDRYVPSGDVLKALQAANPEAEIPGELIFSLTGQIPGGFAKGGVVRRMASGGQLGTNTISSGATGQQSVGLGTFGGANTGQDTSQTLGASSNYLAPNASYMAAQQAQQAQAAAPTSQPQAAGQASAGPTDNSIKGQILAQNPGIQYGSQEYWQAYDKMQSNFGANGQLGWLANAAGTSGDYAADPNRYMGFNAYGNSTLDDQNALAGQNGLFALGFDQNKQQLMQQNGWTEQQYNNALRNQSLYGNQFLGGAFMGNLPTALQGDAGHPMPGNLNVNTPEGKAQLDAMIKAAGAGHQFNGIQALTGTYESPWLTQTEGTGDSGSSRTTANFNPLFQAAAQSGFDLSKYNFDPNSQNGQMDAQKAYNDLNDYLKDYHTVHTLSSNYGDTSRGDRSNANVLYKDDGSGNWQPVYVGREGTEREKGNWFQENPEFLSIVSLMLPMVGGFAGLAGMAGAGATTAGEAAAINAAGGAAMGAAGGGTKGALTGALGGAGGYFGGQAGSSLAGAYAPAYQQAGQQVGSWVGSQAGKAAANKMGSQWRKGGLVRAYDQARTR